MEPSSPSKRITRLRLFEKLISTPSAGAAAGIALINTVGNVAGFAAPYITGAVKDAINSYVRPMVIVGA